LEWCFFSAFKEEAYAEEGTNQASTRENTGGIRLFPKNSESYSFDKAHRFKSSLVTMLSSRTFFPANPVKESAFTGVRNVCSSSGRNTFRGIKSIMWVISFSNAYRVLKWEHLTLNKWSPFAVNGYVGGSAGKILEQPII
jgi:hypothetical protein